jgi:hypothetical protein
VARRTPLEHTGPLVILDPTVDQGTLEHALGRPVTRVECQPCAAVVAQIPRRLTRRTSLRNQAGLVRWLLATREGTLGVVADRPGDVAGQLTDAERGRIRLGSWDGDLAVVGRCAATIVLGCPPVSAREVRRRLLQTGQLDAVSGGRGQEWALTREQILWGRLGRVLAGLGGIVVLVSDEGLGFPAFPRAVTALDATDSALLGPLRGIPATFLSSPQKEPLHLYAGDTKVAAILKGKSTKDLCQEIGRPERTVRRHLKRLQHAGLVRFLGHKRGWVAAGCRGGE